MFMLYRVYVSTPNNDKTVVQQETIKFFLFFNNDDIGTTRVHTLLKTDGRNYHCNGDVFDVVD